jgi:hypothetical protein
MYQERDLDALLAGTDLRYPEVIGIGRGHSPKYQRSEHLGAGASF